MATFAFALPYYFFLLLNLVASSKYGDGPGALKNAIPDPFVFPPSVFLVNSAITFIFLPAFNPRLIIIFLLIRMYGHCLLDLPNSRWPLLSDNPI
ncbi:hypothetical protein F5882DRAFT_414143 [Hyaloscypha sp. PMI_1271]|nr:hypothetical protein F5882DRAFT_414143 [Hyaloscypha sp. PMI_1271]